MTPALIVCERHSRYAPALSRLTTLPLQEVRSLPQVRSAVLASPHSVVALEVNGPPLAHLVDVAWWAKHHGTLALIAISRREMQRYDSWLMAAGADLIFRSHLDLPMASRLLHRCQKQLERLPSPQHRLPFREQVWQRLPWKRYDSGGRSQAKKGNNG